MKYIKKISEYLENKWYKLLNYISNKKETTGNIRTSFNQMKVKILYIKMCGMQLKADCKRKFMVLNVYIRKIRTV